MTLRHRTEQRYRNSVRAEEIRKISIPRYPITRSFGRHNENWRRVGANSEHQVLNAMFDLVMFLVMTFTLSVAMTRMPLAAGVFMPIGRITRSTASKCRNGSQCHDGRRHISGLLQKISSAGHPELLSLAKPSARFFADHFDYEW